MKTSHISPKHFIFAGVSIAALVCLAIVWHQFYSPGEGTRDTDLLAKVGPHEIRAEQFRTEMVRRAGSHPERLDKNMLLEQMVDYETLVLKAMEAGIDKDPEIIRSYRNLLIGRLKRRELTPRIKGADITDEEIQAHYDANADTYTRQAKARLAIIHMKTHPAMPEEKLSALRERMVQAREKAMNASGGRGFGKLSIDYSEDQSTRYKGGDIGWVEKGRKYRWDPLVVAKGFSLEKIGDISEVITTDAGLCLVKLLDRRESVVTPLEKVKTRIRHKLLLEKRRQIEKDFLTEKRSDTEIITYPEALEAISFPSDPDHGGKEPPSLP